MEIYHFVNGNPPTHLHTLERMPDHGYIWIDLLRGQDENWEAWPKKLLDVEVDAQHLEDAASVEHISFFDGTNDYDMVIFEGLGPKDDPYPLETRSAALFIFDRLLISIHSDDALSFTLSKKRVCTPRGKPPPSALELAYTIIDTMVDRFLGVRGVFDKHTTQLQDDLLNPDTPTENWRGLLDGRRIARRLESLSEDQLEAIDGWRRGTRLEWDRPTQVRMRDLSEHVARVRDHASGIERDLEAAVQLHFAAMSQRQNEIMKIFTVITVIFMPLSLLTGIWGMNFKFMPELEWHYGYFFALATILGLGIGTWVWFRKRHFF